MNVVIRQQGSRWQQIARRIRVPLGFAVAALFLVFAHPGLRSLLLSLPFVLAGLVLRGYAAGYVKKNAELTCTGPYAYTRNPLYLGSLLITLGFGIASARVWLLLLLAALFAVIYVPTIRSEEAFLRATFPEFDEYARRVPRLIPRWTPARFGETRAAAPGSESSRRRFDPERYRHHREYNASMGAAAIYAVLLVRLWTLR